MTSRPLSIVVIGLSLSSSWGNGHATTYRALLKSFAALGHRILFLEREVPWYSAHRDLAHPDFCRLRFYRSLGELETWRPAIAAADAVIVGSYVPDGVAIGALVQSWARGRTVFYDIDTPVTVAKLDAGDCDYLSPELVANYDLYLSFSGGPLLELLMDQYGARRALPLYCSVDPELYLPTGAAKRWDLSYLGTYSDDRQQTLDRLLLDVARQAPELAFAVAGPQYPATIQWPANVERLDHVAPAEHAAFYSASRFTLNVTRRDMIRAGFSPSVRLFEAAACGVPIISDRWAGLDTLFRPGEEIVLASEAGDVLRTLRRPDAAFAREIAEGARRRVLADHTAAHRARELEQYVRELGAAQPVAATA